MYDASMRPGFTPAARALHMLSKLSYRSGAGRRSRNFGRELRRTNLLVLFTWLALISVLSAQKLTAQNLGDYGFDHWKVEDGLSQGTVLSVLQDSRGYLWLGTHDGLNKFDGYGFRIFRKDSDDPYSLNENIITALAEDRDGNIWIGTGGGGVNILDPRNERMVRLLSRINVQYSRSGGVINALCVDNAGTLWIGTDGDGLIGFSPVDSSLRVFRHNALSDMGIGGDFITDIAVADDDHLWIAVRGVGVELLDITDGRCRHFLRDEHSVNSSLRNGLIHLAVQDTTRLWIATSHAGLFLLERTSEHDGRIHKVPPPDRNPVSTIRSLIVDKHDQLWIGTDIDGLLMMDTRSMRYRTYSHQIFDERSLQRAGITSLYEDRSGNIWIGMNGRGVSVWSDAAKPFHLMRASGGSPTKITVRSIRAIYQDADSILWIGGYTGLNRIDRRTGELRVYPRIAATGKRGRAVKGLYNTNIFSIHPDPDDPFGSLYLGTEGDGLYRLDIARGVIHRLPIGVSPDSPHLRGMAIYEIFVDSKHNLWIGTEKGLSCQFAGDEHFTHFEHDPHNPFSLNYGSIHCVYEDSNGYIWIGSDRGGLGLFNPTNRDFTRFAHNPDDPSTLSSNRIYSIYEDQRRMLWIGTSSGLNSLNMKNGSFRHFTTNDGLPNDVIYGILEDEKTYLWLSTNRGLARFHPFRGVMEEFDASDNLQGEEFNAAASFRTSDGEMFFGGVDGLTHFMPMEIQKNPYIPPIAITSCSVADRRILPRWNAETGRDLYEIEYGEETVTFSYAALSLYRAKKNRYRYRLDGINHQWIEAGHDRDITFVSLPPGHYVFRVKGSNNDDNWNQKGTAVELVIKAPFWSSWWFRGILAVLLLLVMTALYRWRVALIRRQERILSTTVEERTAELRHSNASLLQEIEERKKAEQLAYRANATKTEFLAHLSHEIRTPMNAILGFTELLQNQVEKEDHRSHLRSIEISGNALLTLINDILDLSKIEAGRLELEFNPIDIRDLLMEVRHVFAFQIQKKGIDFVIAHDESIPPSLLLDEVRTRQILFNLVGNAVKYTDNGAVTIETRASDISAASCTLHILVRDTGIGIAPSQLASIFEPFHRGSRLRTGERAGSGLGLAITQRLVEAMGGTIQVDSKLGQGSVFRIRIPRTRVASVDAFTREVALEDLALSMPEASHPNTKAAETEEALTEDRREVLRLLLQELNRECMPLWKKVRKSHHIQEMEELAGRVHVHAEKAGFSPLVLWSDMLKNQTKNFDMDHIPITLQQFSEKLSELKRITESEA
ncbi:MAG: hypothetical protein C0600_06010 [Ignavibacteria bacterium]|nr:MAG: hypothetical protein C0600_06010 [Ignavibacteria bacterium]